MNMDFAAAFAERAASYDATDSFVTETYATLRDGGKSYNEVCALVRAIGRSCGATALTLSMHQHLVAAALWNHRHGKPGEKLLRAIAADEKSS